MFGIKLKKIVIYIAIAFLSLLITSLSLLRLSHNKWTYSFNPIQPSSISEAKSQDYLISENLQILKAEGVSKEYMNVIRNSFRFWSIKRSKRQMIGAFLFIDLDDARDRTLRVDCINEKPFKRFGIDKFDVMRLTYPLDSVFKDNNLSSGVITSGSSRGFACSQNDTVELSFFMPISRQYNNQLFNVFSKVKVVLE